MQHVEIQVRGHIDKDWSTWLGELEIHHLVTGNTALTGSVRDQAALYGLIARLRDLGLSLQMVKVTPPDVAPK